MVPVRPESARVRRSLADSGGQSAGLRRTLAGLRGPVKIIELDTLFEVLHLEKEGGGETTLVPPPEQKSISDLLFVRSVRVLLVRNHEGWICVSNITITNISPRR